MAREEKTIANNKKAFHDYFVDERFETGIALTGTEVKSLRESGASLRDTFATVRNSEVWLHGVHIAPYSHGNRSNVEPGRARKLLLHRKEIRYLIGKTKVGGYALVPIRLYFTGANLVKVERGLARGKSVYAKSYGLAGKDEKRAAARGVRGRAKGG